MEDVPVSSLEQNTNRVQLIEADPDIQAYGHVTPDLLERRLKAHALLGDTVLIGGTHALKSDLTYKVLQRNKPLLEKGVVVPTTSASHDGWEDMIDRKLRNPRQYGPMWTSNREYKTDEDSLYNRVSALKGSKKRIIRDIKSMRDIYSGDLETELADPKSTLYAEISKHTNPRELRKAIQETNHSSRKFVAERAPGPVRDLLKYQSDISYHLTGAAGHRAVATFHPWDFNPRGSHFDKLVRVREQDDERFHEVVEWSGNSQDRNTESTTVLRPRYTENWDLLGLKTFFEISSDIDRAVANLPPETVLELRKKRVTRDLRRKLCEVVTTLGSTESGRSSTHDLWETEEEFRIELQNALEEEHGTEQDRFRRARSIFSTDLRSMGGIANAASALAVCEAAEALIGSGDVSTVAGTLGAIFMQNKLASTVFPELVETDFHDFEREYRHAVSE